MAFFLRVGHVERLITHIGPLSRLCETKGRVKSLSVDKPLDFFGATGTLDRQEIFVEIQCLHDVFVEYVMVELDPFPSGHDLV